MSEILTCILANNRLFGNDDEILRESNSLSDVQTIQFNNNPVTCGVDTNIQDAAKLMREHKVGSIVIVDNDQRPIGIITDRDFQK